MPGLDSRQLAATDAGPHRADRKVSMSRARAGSSGLAVALITVLILVLEALAYLRVEGVRPALTVYYLGVPDTTPEFSSEAAPDAYLAGTQPRGR
jgi:hypothetical protein